MKLFHVYCPSPKTWLSPTTLATLHIFSTFQHGTMSIFRSWIFSFFFSIYVHFLHQFINVLKYHLYSTEIYIYSQHLFSESRLVNLTTYSTSLLRYLMLNITKPKLQTSNPHLVLPLVFSASLKSNPIVPVSQAKSFRIVHCLGTSLCFPHTPHPMCLQINFKNNQNRTILTTSNTTQVQAPLPLTFISTLASY